MDFLSLAIAIGLASVPLVLVVSLWRWLNRFTTLSPRNAVLVTSAGALVGAGALLLQSALLDVTGLSLVATRQGARGALLAMFLLVAPLGEATKLLCVWPLVKRRRISSPRFGVLYAACAAAGFAAAEVLFFLYKTPLSTGTLLRAGLAIPGHLFFASLWGYALGTGRGRKGRWFSAAWLVALSLHGLYAHIIFGRALGLLIAAAPLALAMALATWMGLRDIAPASSTHSHRLSILPSFDPPTIEEVKHALRRSDRPLMFHWIAMGTLVNIGVVITFLTLSVVLGRRIGIDFAAVDETTLSAMGPIALLGTGGLFAFPFAGYLVAKASAASSMLEPALASALAILTLVAALGTTAPITLLFALAAAPIAFAMACGGAWVGISR